MEINIENNTSNFYMYLLSIVGIGMCIFVFQIGYETCLKKYGFEDPIIEMLDKREEEYQQYQDIEMEHVLHKCSMCKRGMGKNSNVYCYMDKHFCTTLQSFL